MSPVLDIMQGCSRRESLKVPGDKGLGIYKRKQWCLLMFVHSHAQIDLNIKFISSSKGFIQQFNNVIKDLYYSPQADWPPTTMA